MQMRLDPALALEHCAPPDDALLVSCTRAVEAAWDRLAGEQLVRELLLAGERIC